LLKFIQKTLQLGSKLRPIEQLCSYNYIISNKQLRNILLFFERPSIIIEMEKIDLLNVTEESLPSSLYLGKSLLTNANWDEYSF
jgi:hypothetical protein